MYFIFTVVNSQPHHEQFHPPEQVRWDCSQRVNMLKSWIYVIRPLRGEYALLPVVLHRYYHTCKRGTPSSTSPIILKSLLLSFLLPLSLLHPHPRILLCTTTCLPFAYSSGERRLTIPKDKLPKAKNHRTPGTHFFPTRVFDWKQKSLRTTVTPPLTLRHHLNLHLPSTPLSTQSHCLCNFPSACEV